MVSACGSIGQIGDQFGNLKLLGSSGEAANVSIAVESVDGPPSAVHARFLRALKEEAGSRQIAVVESAVAHYRLRGYLAAHPEGGATAISWAWDVYDSGQRRAFRLKGEDKAAGTGWANADDRLLRRMAGSALDQLAGFVATPRQAAAAPAVATAEAAPQPAPEKPRSSLAWLDDWAPEKSGIFRIFRRDEDAKTEVAALPDQPPPGTVPMPRIRPTSAAPPSGRALAFAAAGE